MITTASPRAVTPHAEKMAVARPEALQASSGVFAPASRSRHRARALLDAWLLSMRPRTLPLACCGIVTGNALAAVSGAPWRGGIFWAALATALLLQLLANLANDYGDHAHRADTSARLGPIRGMQLGLISAVEMKKAIWLVMLLSIFSGATLTVLACRALVDTLNFFALGAVSIAAALGYTLGRHAYGYRGLGDLSVFIFFGWVAVLGSHYLQAHALDPRVFVPATACGLLSVAVLNVNNLRDLDEDRRSGKITFAAMLGMRRARQYHFVLLTAGFFFLVWSACLWDGERPWVWLFLLALPLFARNAAAALRFHEPSQFRAQLPVVIGINMVALGGFTGGLTIGA